MHASCQQIRQFLGKHESLRVVSVILSALVIGYILQYRTSGQNIVKDTQASARSNSEEPLATKPLPKDPDYAAPDGSDVRLLSRGHRGSMAHFELAPGHTSKSVAHRSVEEIWYFLVGDGEMWRKLGDQEITVEVHAGVSLTIPKGTSFQFRSLGTEPLKAVAVTMPPWPGPEEAYAVPGKWPASGK